jgi:adenylate cyclase
VSDPDENDPIPATDPVADWLVGQESRKLPLADLLPHLARRLDDEGIRIWRVTMGFPALHPEVLVLSLLWYRGQEAQTIERFHGVQQTPQYLNSPFKTVHDGAPYVRCRLQGPDADLSYPICRELAEEGGTDYVVVPVHYARDAVSAVAIATDAPGGFTPPQLERLRALIPYVGIRLELESAYRDSYSLLEVYLGHNAAARVMHGTVRRGGGESIEAALFSCDLRGFTALSDTRRPEEVVAILDRYFEAVATPIESWGGEVLKFIGDALLAVFPVGEDGPTVACMGALSAAREALEAMDAVREASAIEGVALEMGIGLHLGQAFYGNIGARRRLDFTVIGAAVNEVCRIEPLTKTLGVPILVSAAFAEVCPEGELRCLGEHRLRGVSRAQRLFTTTELAPAAEAV